MNKTIKFKSFLYIFLSIFSVFVFYHLLVWELYTSKIFQRDDKSYGIGDLGRMSYQVDSLHLRKVEYTLSKLHLNHNDINNSNIDVITIGDSFSNGGAGGLNPYYQDYLATEHNQNILNLRKLVNNDYDMFALVLSLYNNGWLAKNKPKAIIIESSERGLYQRFTKEYDLKDVNISFKSMVEKVIHNSPYIPELLRINTANYKIPFYTIKYKFNHKAQKNVGKMTLNDNMFSTSDYQNKLLFHYDDIKYMENNLKKVKSINKNFNKLAVLLKTLDIKLFFMPAVDKYDVYSDFILNNNLPKNKFFDMLRPLKKEYYFVDTKAILTLLIKNGVKDVFYSDDTHWSYKASEAIAKDKVFDSLK